MKDAKCTVVLFAFASEMTSSLLRTSDSSQAQIFLSVFHNYSAAALGTGIFMAFGLGTGVRTKL